MGNISIVHSDPSKKEYPITTLHPLPVTEVGGGTIKTSSIEFQQVSGVPTTTETTVLSFTNTGASLYIEAIGGEGTARSEWFVYINTNLKIKIRSSTAEPAVELPLYDFKLANGDIIDVKVKHYEPATQSFSCNVRYYR